MSMRGRDLGAKAGYFKIGEGQLLPMLEPDDPGERSTWPERHRRRMKEGDEQMLAALARLATLPRHGSPSYQKNGRRDIAEPTES